MIDHFLLRDDEVWYRDATGARRSGVIAEVPPGALEATTAESIARVRDVRTADIVEVTIGGLLAEMDAMGVENRARSAAADVS